MSTINVNGVELEFDTLDVDTMASYEKALAKIDKVDETALKGLTPSENIRKQCRAIFDFFNDLFGEGTDKRLFGEKTNIGICLDAFDLVITEAGDQFAQFSKRLEKYDTSRIKK